MISDVLATGAVSISGMRKTSFSAKSAAATEEACTTTGRVLMLPIVDVTAFIMARFLSRAPMSKLHWPPSDRASCSTGVWSRSVPPFPPCAGCATRSARLKEVMIVGWPYNFVFALLHYMMIGLRPESSASFHATALLLVVNRFRARFGLDCQCPGNMIVGFGMGLVELAAILPGVGLIVGSFPAITTGFEAMHLGGMIYIASFSSLG